MISNFLCCLIFRLISNFIYCLILCQLRTYEMLNTIVNPSNNLCIICFLGIYYSNITLINIPRYHISSTNISTYLFTHKEISHYITLKQIILFIQPYTYRLKRIISWSKSSHLVVIINKQRKLECKRKEKKKEMLNSRN